MSDRMDKGDLSESDELVKIDESKEDAESIRRGCGLNGRNASASEQVEHNNADLR